MFQQTATEEFGKSLISWNILKITGRIFKNFYVPEFAENENRQSSSQSYPQKWTLCRKAPSFTDNQSLWYRKTREGLFLLSIIQAAGWPIWPLILCSVLAVALILERTFQLQDTKVMPANILTQTIEATQRGVPLTEMIQTLDKAGAMGPVLASGLRCLQANPKATSEDIQAHMQMAGRLAAQGLERYLPALATIASAAPLLGLLGTVVGMIEIFGAHTAANNQPALLAHGISVALYNTAFGLIVAIPALMFWRYFRTVVDRHVLAMEVAAERFARHLSRAGN
jgi:biopolymer transport protein ExbB